MAGIIEIKDGKLFRYFEGQTTCIEPWGKNALSQPNTPLALPISRVSSKLGLSVRLL